MRSGDDLSLDCGEAGGDLKPGRSEDKLRGYRLCRHQPGRTFLELLMEEIA